MKVKSSTFIYFFAAYRLNPANVMKNTKYLLDCWRQLKAVYLINEAIKDAK